MVLGLPSISEWLSQQNQKVQAQFEMIFMLAPFMAGWMVFLYHWVFELKSEMDSLPLPSVIMSVGYMFYFRWKNKILEEASSLDAVNMKVRWWEGFEQGLSNVIAGWMDLSDKEAYGDAEPLLAVPRRCAQCEAPIPPGLKAPELCPICKTPIPTLAQYLLGGEKMLYTKIRFENRMVDYEGRLWRWAVFLHYFPKDLTFKKIPGQWFTHKGLMFRTSTASIDVTFIGFKEEIHHIKYFLVTSSPERTRRIQMGVGLTPSDASPDQLKKGKDLSSIRLGIEEYMKRREAEAHADLSFESQIDAKTLGYKGSERILDDHDGIRSRRGAGGTLRENWKKYVVYGLILVAVVWFAWSSGWFGGGTPPLPSPTPVYPNGSVIPG